MTIQELEQKINEANEAYRTGDSIMTDAQYDALIDELTTLDPENKTLFEVGLEVIDDSRKQTLPIVMASMNKIKTADEISKWLKSKSIPQTTEFILTPKFDGASLCVEENTESAWTRGDGKEGQRSDEHLALMNTNTFDNDIITFGEAIMKRDTFSTKYSEEFSNPRNLVAGQLNHKTPNVILKDVDYVRYGLVGMDFDTKKEQLDFLNKTQTNKVQYKIVGTSELTEDYLTDLFAEWNKEYEIDGIIVEVNDETLRTKLGRETSSKNPCYARAFKGDFEEVKETTVLGITWNISKQGLLKPIINVQTINLDGVNVSNVTGNNAKFMMDNGIGIGSTITVKRSGMVIPKLVEVVESTGFELPTIENVEIKWNSNGVELITTTVTEDQRLQQLISFFNILEVDNVGEGVLTQMFNAGFDTAQKVLEMTPGQMEGLDKFGKRKAQIVSGAINSKRDVTLSKIQHASGFFTNLGSKKLLLLEDLDETATMIQISGRDGFSDISATNYLKGIVQYNEWIKDFDGLVTIGKTEVKETVEGGSLEGKAFVFSGVRRKDLNQIIEDMGGRIASGISAKTSHLIMKTTGTGSAKEKKAEKLGQTIMTVEELETLLNV